MAKKKTEDTSEEIEVTPAATTEGSVGEVEVTVEKAHKATEEKPVKTKATVAKDEPKVRTQYLF